jgi:GNAT superfamily N-acetyltransferase
MVPAMPTRIQLFGHLRECPGPGIGDPWTSRARRELSNLPRWGYDGFTEARMATPTPTIQRATLDDLPRFEVIRAAAYESVFASFRAVLGDAIYEVAQAHEDAAHHEVLTSLFRPDSVWEVYSVRLDDVIVGFVSVRLDAERKIGEVGLNAVHPDYGGRGIGTAMYEFAVARMREAGMKVATVATGGDPGHAPARRAYQKAGFDVTFPNVWMLRTL